MRNEPLAETEGVVEEERCLALGLDISFYILNFLFYDSLPGYNLVVELVEQLAAVLHLVASESHIRCSGDNDGALQLSENSFLRIGFLVQLYGHLQLLQLLALVLRSDELKTVELVPG